MDQPHKGMEAGGRELGGEQLVGQHVKRFGVLFKVRNVKDSLGVGQVEAGQIRVEAGARGAEVRDTCSCRDACADLFQLSARQWNNSRSNWDTYHEDNVFVLAVA